MHRLPIRLPPGPHRKANGDYKDSLLGLYVIGIAIFFHIDIAFVLLL
jgi:hypothetical protein